MSRIAILAFGSLIDEPGKAISPLIRERIGGCADAILDRVCKVEHALVVVLRLSFPVDVGGSPVNGVLLVLDSAISLAEAKTFLWRRETRRECSEKQYSRPANPGQNQVVVECIENFGGCDVVLYTRYWGEYREAERGQSCGLGNQECAR